MADYPLINGLRYDYSSIEISIAGRTVIGVKEIHYSDKLEPGKVRGTSAQINGRTRGQYDAEGSFSLYKQEAEELIEAISASSGGKGYGEVAFSVAVHFSEAPNSPIYTDRLAGCRIKNVEDAHQEGSDALMSKFDLDIIAILRNGRSLVSNVKV